MLEYRAASASLIANSPSFTSVPPIADVTYTRRTPAWSRTNAICLPSGDQLGFPSNPGSDVSRRTAAECTDLIYTSKLSSCSPFQLNAICSPSGEKAGEYSSPESVVRGTTVIAGATADRASGVRDFQRATAARARTMTPTAVAHRRATCTRPWG